MSDEIIENLSKIGFTQYEAKAYLALLESGPGGGYGVAKNAKIPTAKIYEVLASLVTKGFAESDGMEKPCYHAVEPRGVLDGLNKSFQKRVGDLNELFEKIPMSEARVKASRVTGAEAVHTAISAIITECGNKLLVTGWPEELEEHRVDIERTGKGADVHLLTYGSFLCEKAVVYTHRRVDLVKRELTGRWFLAVNERHQALVAFFDEDSNNVEGIKMESEGLSRIIADHILHDISLNHLMESLPEEFRLDLETELTDLRMRLYI